MLEDAPARKDDPETSANKVELSYHRVLVRNQAADMETFSLSEIADKMYVLFDISKESVRSRVAELMKPRHGCVIYDTGRRQASPTGRTERVLAYDDQTPFGERIERYEDTQRNRLEKRSDA